MINISFISDGDQIAGNLFRAAKPSKFAFLFIQGWTGHQNIEAAQSLADLGFTSLTYDMRGNGESEGSLSEFSRADFLNDAVIAYDYLKQEVGADVQIGVVGSSFGSYTAVLLSERRPVACLSLRVPANYPDQGFDEPQLQQKYESNDFIEWRSKKLRYPENHALTALHNFKGRVQIIEAGADEMVPHEVIESYINAVLEAQQLDYSVMKYAPHSLVNGQLTKKYVHLLTEWARQLIGA